LLENSDIDTIRSDKKLKKGYRVKKLTSLSLSFSALILGTQVTLAGSYQGLVTSTFALGGKVVVTLGGGSGSGYCSTPKFHLDPAVDFDRILLSLIMTAQVSNKTVYVSGASFCETTWPTTGSQHAEAVNLIG
jgi:hypothetical protein